VDTFVFDEFNIVSPRLSLDLLEIIDLEEGRISGLPHQKHQAYRRTRVQ